MLLRLLALALGTALAAKSAFAQSATTPAVEPGYSIQPEWSEAATPFVLSLRHPDWTCATTIGHQSVILGDGTLTLRFSQETNPAVRCMEKVVDYGADFKIPALKAGRFEVFASSGPECIYTQGCKIAEQRVAVGTLTIGAGTAKNDFSLRPAAITAGRPEKIELLSYSYNCATRYTHQSVAVEGGEIHLSYFADRSLEPVSLCPAVMLPYGPSFELPALKPGSYPVYASPLAPCMIEDPACTMAVLPQYVGNLTVKEEPVTPPDEKEGWFLSPRRVKADAPFQMSVLNHAVGNCGTVFEHKTLTEAEEGLWASFSMETDPDIVCIANLTPFGPTFESEGLPAGQYPIAVSVLPSCAFPSNSGDPVCDIAQPIWQAVDTLFVEAAAKEKEVLYVSPVDPKPGLPFDLDLISSDLGCGTFLTDKQVAVDGNTLRLSYGVAIGEIACAAITVDTKVTFEIPALKAGKYDILLDPPENCQAAGFLCDEKWATDPIGVIQIGNSLAIRPGTRLGASSSAPGRVRRLGDRVEIELPAAVRDAGARVALLDLQGREVARSFARAGATTAVFPQVAGAGIHFLKIGAGREAQLRRVVLP